MSSTRHIEWLTNLSTTISAVIGDRVDLDCERLEQSGARTLPKVVLVGPYNAGKTTFIRRMARRDGVTEFGSFTISATPETCKARQLELSKMILVDTPGTQSGRSHHDLEACESTEDIDLLLIILDPHTFVGDIDLLRDLLTGARWNGGEPAPELCPCTVIAVNKIDGLVDDPVLDAGDLEAIIEEKRRDIEMVLEELGAVRAIPVVFCSFDPDGTVSDEAQGTSGANVSAGWDGFEDLAELVEKLASPNESATRLERMCRCAAHGWLDELRKLETAQTPRDLEAEIDLLAAVRRAAETRFAQFEQRVGTELGRIRRELREKTFELSADEIQIVANEATRQVLLKELLKMGAELEQRITGAREVLGQDLPGTAQHREFDRGAPADTMTKLASSTPLVVGGLNFCGELVGTRMVTIAGELQRAGLWQKIFNRSNLAAKAANVQSLQGTLSVLGLAARTAPFLIEAGDYVREKRRASKIAKYRAAVDALVAEVLDSTLETALAGFDDDPGIRPRFEGLLSEIDQKIDEIRSRREEAGDLHGAVERAVSTLVSALMLRKSSWKQCQSTGPRTSE